ncbi:hypothetical protein [Patulibacter sp. SYSU D01012]|uniref:hypothetical protein n=1 Tax=Patulibacter sp. SYSU D01012 TaxID=2817381 RepID=UPI001B30C971|nr:hypothetical protein [Patulibacter sp. SYSU D01012]
MASPAVAPASRPAPVSDAHGILLPGAGPDGTDVYLSDDHPDGRYRDAQLNPSPTGAGSSGDFHVLDNGGTRHAETVTCDSAGFYRNYQPTEDDFRDLVTTYHRGDRISVRDSEAPAHDYRRYGPRGVVVYMMNRWGFMSKNCLSGE